MGPVDEYDVRSAGHRSSLPSRDRSRLARGLALAAGIVALVLVVLLPSTAPARLHPYYVLKGQSFGQVNPKILFVLDTSGSMAYKSNANDQNCVFASCEGGSGTELSRIAAARQAIRQVVDATKDRAKFAMMTFDRLQSPQGSVPSKCDGDSGWWGGGGADTRFEWVTSYQESGSFWGSENANLHGYNGVWKLCDGDKNKPYPYLRWDNLGVSPKVTANNQTGTVPSSPLISTTQANFSNTSNGDRKVQWFPQFMGVRAQLNNTTDPNKDISRATIGDYGKTNNDTDNNVRGHDFYYWPYVDGFPGYSHFETGGLFSSSRMGVVEEDTSANSGALLAPFYLDLSSTPVNPNYWGPASQQASEDMVRAFSGPMTEGGVDVSGGTPWYSTIGPIPAAPTQSNAIFAHSTVGSYLKFVTNVAAPDLCAPLTAVLITDGYPTPSNTEGGWKLYGRLADLRKTLGVKVYVVGYLLEGGPLNDMACAGAGACNGNQCDTPCDDTPTQSWDTCYKPGSPLTDCAYSVDSPSELALTLSGIVYAQLNMNVATGPGSAVNEFALNATDPYGTGNQLQTKVSASTTWPGWKGHVTRALCDDVDPANPNQLAPWCQEPSPKFATSETQPTFGPCAQGRTWDAGTCLQSTDWKARRIYTNKSDKTLIAISDANGNASSAFKTELEALGLISGSDLQAKADTIAQFILGKDWPDGWKLPGLANSAPIVVRRIPQYSDKVTPTVGIRDPHCAGRTLSQVDAAGLPDTLETFAKNAWDSSLKLSSPSAHYEYQEAVIVGDDVGVIHAFQLDSGNELWGYIPRFVLASAAAQSAIGPATRGQPDAIDQHKYGVASSLNHGWVWDDSDADSSKHKWRHLGILGLGEGGKELIALDLSHMSPSSPKGPFEILWTTEDTALKTNYDNYNGETWARPALTYTVPSNVLTSLPDPWVVFGTGYPSASPTSASQGRVMVKANALTGVISETATLPAPSNSLYETSFGTVVDPAVGSHCISRFWAEMQEVYIADPAGRLFRWDLGDGQNHAADSGTTWGTPGAVATFPACQGTGATCTISASGKGDPFIYPPAVTPNNRIDDNAGATSGTVPEGVDQFLIAMVSGSPYDDKLDVALGSDLHSSIYLLADDHSAAGQSHAGFTIPSGAPKSTLASMGANSKYFRLPVTDLTRTRCVKYPSAPNTLDCADVAKFSNKTRPIRSPRINVKSVVDDSSGARIDNLEVAYVTFTLYEPASAQCTNKWYDSTTKSWTADPGSSYEVTLRLTAIDGQGFNFTTGAGNGIANFGGGFATGLSLVGVTQLMDDDSGCTGGACGAQPGTPAVRPCDENATPGSSTSGTATVPLSNKTLHGFTPIAG